MDPARRSLEDLAVAAVAGHPAARRDLARHCIARVRRQAAWAGARGADLEAAVRAVLEQAFGSLATFRGDTLFEAWLDALTARALVAAAARWRDASPASSDRLEQVRRDLDRDDEGELGALVAAAAGPDDAALDPFTERRLERAAIAALDGAPAAAPVPSARPRHWVWAGLGALATAVLALLVLAVVWPSGPPTPPPRLDAVVALSAGGATIAGTPARAGRWVGAGATFDVPGSGRLVLALGDDTILVAAGGARGVVESWTLSDAKVRLDAGTAIARIGRGDLAMQTARLAAHASHATLALTAGGTPTLRVLRGRARAEVHGQRGRTIPEGQAITAPTGETRAVDPGGAALIWALLGRGALAPHGTAIHLATTPPGAEVTVDGEPVGRTPLSILARPGRRRIAVLRAEHAAVREEIRLRARHPETRRYTLAPLRVRAVP